jgi:hypothetical protein
MSKYFAGFILLLALAGCGSETTAIHDIWINEAVKQCAEHGGLVYLSVYIPFGGAPEIRSRCNDGVAITSTIKKGENGS